MAVTNTQNDKPQMQEGLEITPRSSSLLLFFVSLFFSAVYSGKSQFFEKSLLLLVTYGNT